MMTGKMNLIKKTQSIYSIEARKEKKGVIMDLQFWTCKNTWKASAKNTFWCLIGCSIGDFGTIGLFQIFKWSAPVLLIMILAMVNGIITSIILETVILLKGKMGLKESLKTAIGMSLISMLAMEAAMNLTDYFITGGAMITPKALFFSFLAGFIAPYPYNYWRLKKYHRACH